MAEKIAKKVDSKTIIKCKDYEVLQGDLDSPLWVIEIDNKFKIAMDVEEYIELMEMSKKILKENLDLKLEKAILSEFPIDYDDVKAVVLEEMKKDNQKSIDEVVHKIKLEHPNLFYNIDMDKFF